MTGGSDNHLVLIDLRTLRPKVTGSKVELVCDWIGMTVNKNAVVGDKSALSPGGIRIGTQAMVTRGLVTKEGWCDVAIIFHRVVTLCQELQEQFGMKLVSFKKALEDETVQKKLETLKGSISKITSDLR